MRGTSKPVLCVFLLNSPHQIDQNLMAELQNIKAAVHPTDTLLVVDAMTGQEAATLVKTFNDQVDISGGQRAAVSEVQEHHSALLHSSASSM